MAAQRLSIFFAPFLSEVFNFNYVLVHHCLSVSGGLENCAYCGLECVVFIFIFVILLVDQRFSNNHSRFANARSG